MKILLLSIGTRGDVQPMVALALGLQNAGHEVELLAGQNFQEFVESWGVPFLPSLDMNALMQTPEGIAWAQSGDRPFRQLGLMKELLTNNAAPMLRDLESAITDQDLLITGLMLDPFVEALSEISGIPRIHALLQPTRPTRLGPASMIAPFGKSTSVANLWAGRFADRLFWSMTKEITNEFRASHGLTAHSTSSWTKARDKAPVLLGVSPTLVPLANDWQAPAAITGFWDLPPKPWNPTEELEDFLQAGEPPLFIGFGSMTHAHGQESWREISEGLTKTGLRAIISTDEDLHLSENIYLLSYCPHDWLFPRCSAVIHHGGAGTTAAALRACRPSWIIPHMSDQPYWGRRVAELGAGLPPVPLHKLTPRGFSKGIRLLLDPDRYETLSTGARRVGEAIQKEKGVENGVVAIQKYFR